ncbi:hypothetical protein VNO78_16009 [Psophocarpus tetragonolobus]|uniref:Uncharacterized protein n=1 Tax=Psophocarpus tetragonolobus TaxID=3891 RepID=A0AAN9SFZ1_PSOTE
MVEMFPLNSADAIYTKLYGMISTLRDPFTQIISQRNSKGLELEVTGKHHPLNWLAFGLNGGEIVFNPYATVGEITKPIYIATHDASCMSSLSRNSWFFINLSSNFHLHLYTIILFYNLEDKGLMMLRSKQRVLLVGDYPPFLQASKSPQTGEATNPLYVMINPI